VFIEKAYKDNLITREQREEARKKWLTFKRGWGFWGLAKTQKEIERIGWGGLFGSVWAGFSTFVSQLGKLIQKDSSGR